MKPPKKNVKILGASLASLATIFSVPFAAHQYLDGRYALASEQRKLEDDFEVHKLEAVQTKAMDEYYEAKKLAKKYPDDEELKDNLEKAQKRLELIERQISTIKSRETGTTGEPKE